MAMTFEPFRELTRLEEERRLAADGHSTEERPGKRKRSEAEPDNVIRERGDGTVNQNDPVTLGYLSEPEGKRLFDAWVITRGFV